MEVWTNKNQSFGAQSPTNSSLWTHFTIQKNELGLVKLNILINKFNN